MIDGTCKGCGEPLTIPEETTELGGYCMECFECGVPKLDARIAELEAENASLRYSLTGARKAIDKIIETESDRVREAYDFMVAENERLRESNAKLIAACRAVTDRSNKIEPGYATAADVLIATKTYLLAVITEAEKASNNQPSPPNERNV